METFLFRLCVYVAPLSAFLWRLRQGPSPDCVVHTVRATSAHYIYHYLGFSFHRSWNLFICVACGRRIFENSMQIKMCTFTWRLFNKLERRYFHVSYYYHARNRMKQTIHCFSRRLMSSVGSHDQITFRDIIAFRKEQAKCSVIVEFPVSCNPSKLHDICSSCGQIKKVRDWKNLAGKNFLLVEFHEEYAVKALLSKCGYQGPGDGLPTFSHLLYYKNVIGKSSKNNKTSQNELEPQDLGKASEFTGNSFVSEKMILIYQIEKLKDIHTSLRFIMCTVLEEALKGIFPNCKFIPVGSTVNGFGSLRSDLNLCFAVNTKENLWNSNFCHSTKKAPNLYKDADRHILCTVGDILDTFLPCISRVKKNMLTTPSVIRFQHHILDISCSITINDTPSMFMSELLFLCGELDSRVKLLVLIVKQWAYDAKVTQNYSGSNISSFALTIMVIFFLQTHSHPILPPLNEIQYQGLSNNFKGQNDETADSLLKGFFYFLSTFNFRSKSISVNSAEAHTKPDFSPLHIQNPMDQQLNLCNGVTQQKLDTLIETASHTLWNLENISHNSVMKSGLMEVLLPNVEQTNVKNAKMS